MEVTGNIISVTLHVKPVMLSMFLLRYILLTNKYLKYIPLNNTSTYFESIRIIIVFK